MKATKISAVLSGELKKYEYLTGEDLGYKLGVVENLSLNVLHLAKFLIKYLVKKTKKKRLLKKLINIECKNEEKLKAIKYQRERQLHIIDIGEKYN